MSGAEFREEKKHQTLLFVNEIREAMELDKLDELPKGYKTSHISCPIALALEQQYKVYDEGGVLVPKNRTLDEVIEKGAEIPGAIEFPSDVVWFIDMFDKGEYPELVLED